MNNIYFNMMVLIYCLYLCITVTMTVEGEARLCACKTSLSPTVILYYWLFQDNTTGRSEAILLWWFYLFYILMLKFCAVCTSCTVRVTEWQPIRK